MSARPALLSGAILAALAAATGLAFAGWVEHGAAMVLALGESGIAWCF